MSIDSKKFHLVVAFVRLHTCSDVILQAPSRSSGRAHVCVDFASVSLELNLKLY